MYAVWKGTKQNVQAHHNQAQAFRYLRCWFRPWLCWLHHHFEQLIHLWKFYSAMVYSILGRQVPLSNPPVVGYGEILLLYICLCEIFWSHIHECQEQLCARKTWPVLQVTQGILRIVCVALTQLPSSGACPLRALYHIVPCNFLWWGIAHTYAQGVKGQITLDTTSHNRLLYPFVYWQAERTCHLNVILKQLEFLLTLYKRVSHKPGCISKSWAQVVALEQVCACGWCYLNVHEASHLQLLEWANGVIVKCRGDCGVVFVCANLHFYMLAIAQKQ